MSQWAASRTPRFGHGGIYRSDETFRGGSRINLRSKRSVCSDKNGGSRLRTSRLSPSQQKSEQLSKAIIAPLPGLGLTSDTLLVVFAHASGRTISQARTVCKLWNTICTELQHKNPLHTREVLVPLLLFLPSFADLARAAAVCTLWSSAARAEQRHWRDAVREQAQVRQTIPLSVSSVPLVDKAVLIAARFGLDPLRCGGVTRCIQSAFAALDLADVTHGPGIGSTAELTLIAQPSQLPHTQSQSHNGANGSASGSSLVMIACLERVPARTTHLADMLATALLLVPPGNDEADEVTSEYTVDNSDHGEAE